jgi:hypothetical protein
MDNATDKLYQIKLTIRGNRTHTCSAISTIMRWGPLDILYMSWLFYSINISTLTFVNGVYIFSGSQKQVYIRTLLFGDSQKDQVQNICYRKQYSHSLRTVGDSLKEHNPTPVLLICYNHFFLYYKCLYTYYLSWSQTYICMILEKTSNKL